nr:MAG TPA: hypothetical protein [Caudoviricetes sp.]DAK28431.1 MAG TPA: hypothetical protein [Caudoviricetes sp.]DAL01536.1 MAG TPA: hypothetical protein [Caudoviricetes sp.]DAR51671.1 MAG TPA: hypothetical protein [Caudoviricetes sp.]DAT42887.1 MAG TPA: hypothetical protein [Caudoviricetes sp.]
MYVRRTRTYLIPFYTSLNRHLPIWEGVFLLVWNPRP